METGINFYLRLQLFLKESCRIMRTLFVKMAKSDTNYASTYTTLSAYMHFRQNDITDLLKKNIIRSYQNDILFNLGRPVEEDDLDITLVSCLTLNLFSALPTQEQKWIELVRQIRNDINHLPDVADMNRTEFDAYWKNLEMSTMGLAQFIDISLATDLKNISCDLKDKDFAASAPIISIIKDLTNVNRELLIEIGCLNSIKSTAEATHEKLVSVIHQTDDVEEPLPKRVKILNTLHENMIESFKRAMETISEDLLPTPEIEELHDRLINDKFLFVVGPKSSGYIDKVITALKTLKTKHVDINKKRCIEMSKIDEFPHVNIDDVGLLWLRDPLGKNDILQNKLMEVHSYLNRIVDVLDEMCFQDRFYFVITSDIENYSEYIKECNEEPHKYLKKEGVIKLDLEVTSPVEILDDEEYYSSVTDSVLQNLKEETKLIIESVKDDSKTPEQYTDAAAIFKQNKTIFIIGPRHSGKTTIAVKLSTRYKLHQCLFLSSPADAKYIHLKQHALVVIEDFTGKHSVNKEMALSWYRHFDHLMRAVRKGIVSVIITSVSSAFESCQLPHHDIMNNRIELGDHLPVVKFENKDGSGAFSGNIMTDSSDSDSQDSSFTRRKKKRMRSRGYSFSDEDQYDQDYPDDEFEDEEELDLQEYLDDDDDTVYDDDDGNIFSDNEIKEDDMDSDFGNIVQLDEVESLEF